MGWGSWNPVKIVKKAVTSVRKAVKKVVKGIGKVAKKVWNGVKSVASKIGKAVTKMGPLASIALSMMMPGFGLTGIWGAMAKGAATGFITSGGSLKGALVGAAGGGIGYGISQGVSAFKTGYAGVSEGGSFYSKLEAGFDSVGTSTSDGVAQMYNSAVDVLSTGDVSKFNYLDDSGNYVNASKSSTGLFDPAGTPTPTVVDTGTAVFENANKAYVKTLDPKAQEFIAKNNNGTITSKQLNEVYENQYVNDPLLAPKTAPVTTVPNQFDTDPLLAPVTEPMQKAIGPVMEDGTYGALSPAQEAALGMDSATYNAKLLQEKQINETLAKPREKSWTDKIDGKAVADAFKKNFLSPDTGSSAATGLMSATPKAVKAGEGGTGDAQGRYGYGSDYYDVTKIGLLSAQQRMQMAQQTT